jgi:hypothetical protein
MWYDETVGLYFTPSGRVYNPRLGRWMQRDPIHTGMPHVSWSRTNGPHITVMPMHTPPYVDGLSPYEYVRSNPVNRRDPSGMFSLADFASTTAIRLELAGSSFAAAHPLAIRFVGGLLAAANLYAFAQYEEVQAIVLSQPNAGGFLASEAVALRMALRDLTSTAGSITALLRANSATRAAATTATAVINGEFASATGQIHHAVSTPIWRALQEHRILHGRYVARDPRFVTRAANDAAHRGYQQWHRDIDDEVIRWLRQHADATADEFAHFLRGIYNRPELRQRFPHGLE